MTRTKFAAFAGLLAGVLILPTVPVSADMQKNEAPNQWRSSEQRRPDHDRDEHHFRRNAHHDRRGHHKPERQKDFHAVGGAKKEVRHDRKELHSDNRELRKDRAELRRDIRNGAGKQEIFQDHREIRGDFKEIAKDRNELQQDQAKLETARRELKADLHKR